jgi:hypothetical protein
LEPGAADTIREALRHGYSITGVMSWNVPYRIGEFLDHDAWRGEWFSGDAEEEDEEEED